jgi:hypothetical protein
VFVCVCVWSCLCQRVLVCVFGNYCKEGRKGVMTNLSETENKHKTVLEEMYFFLIFTR